MLDGNENYTTSWSGHAASHANDTPLDEAVATEVLNLLMSAESVQEVFGLRAVNRNTHRRSFPVPMHPTLELGTGLIEEFLCGNCTCFDLTNKVVARALYLHWRINGGCVRASCNTSMMPASNKYGLTQHGEVICASCASKTLSG